MLYVASEPSLSVIKRRLKTFLLRRLYPAYLTLHRSGLKNTLAALNRFMVKVIIMCLFFYLVVQTRQIYAKLHEGKLDSSV